jgi:uncharacterized delta-60 repeat protein
MKRVKNILTRFFLIVAIFGGSIFNSFAQPGSLDTLFGNGGKVITSFTNFGDAARVIAIQNDKKIILGGNTKPNSFAKTNSLLVRYNSDGTLDTSFGIGGKVVESAGSVSVLAIQTDGKIIAGSSFTLMRFTSKGIIDTSFGIGGKVVTDIKGYYSEQSRAIVIQNDGKIILGGYGQESGPDKPHFMLIRYHKNGSLDSTFGVGGIVIGDVGNCNSIALQSDGKIIAGGAFDFSFALARYNTNGSLDNTFGTAGRVITSVGSTSGGQSVAIQKSGKIVLIGWTNEGAGISTSTALVRYNTDGSLDNAFGTGGKVITQWGTSSKGNSISIQNDEKIVVGGFAKKGSNHNNFALARYNTDGSLDNTFGDAGEAVTPVGPLNSQSDAIAIHKNGKIVLTGYAYNGTKTNIALVQYNNDAGALSIEDCCKQNEISAYPNPFSTSITIALSKPLNNATLKLYDAYGKLVKQQTNISKQNIIVSRDYLPKGIYLLQLQENNRTITTKKLLISGE